MILNNEKAINLLTIQEDYWKSINNPEFALLCSEIKELLKKEVWHKFSEDPPTKDGTYLFRMINSKTRYVVNRYLVGEKALVFDGYDVSDIIAWKEIHEFEEELK